MTCDFTAFSTIFQSYQDDWRVIMKSIVQWNPVYEPGIARSIGYRFIYRATGAPLGGLSGKSQEDVGRPLMTSCGCRTVPTARCTRS